MSFNFKVIGKDKKSRARAGEFETAHGKVLTPTFVPVGTQASIKALTPQDFKEIGIQFFFGNTYHLHLRPGEDVIKDFGGLAQFMGWDGPTITDSGGFQVFSLGAKKVMTRTGRTTVKIPYESPETLKKQVNIESKDDKGEWSLESLVRITDDGVEFRSHIDGDKHYFTPEQSIKIQKKLGANIILSFDECPPFPSTWQEAKAANERTHAWAARGLKEFQNKESTFFEQGLVGIVQGSTFQDLREESAKIIGAMDFDALAIGGVSVGESKEDMRNAIQWVVPHLPENKFRHLLGIGEVDDIFDAIELGMDTMDCVIPSRLGRTGFIFVHPPEGTMKNRFRIDLMKSVFIHSNDPLDPGCSCYVCKTFTRGYIHHLFRAHELLAYRLATYHNVYYLMDLTRKIREAILEDNFQEMKLNWLKA